MVELDGVYKKTGADYTLSNISLSIADGEAAAVTGRRASGKTALADIMSGCAYATHGSVVVNGSDMQRRPLEAKRAVGYMPQRPMLYPEMTVNEYLCFICSLKGVPRKAARDRAQAALLKAGAAEAGEQLVRSLTRITLQRAALAGALCADPKALILDEPFAGLDPDESEGFRETITSLKGQYTLVLLTRSIREAAGICDNIIVLRKGAVAARQSAQSLLDAAGSQRRLKVRLKAGREVGLRLLRSVEGVEYAEALGCNESGTFDFAVESAADAREGIFLAASKANMVLLGMSSVKLTLEDIFSELAGGEETDRWEPYTVKS